MNLKMMQNPKQLFWRINRSNYFTLDLIKVIKFYTKLWKAKDLMKLMKRCFKKDAYLDYSLD